MTALSRKSKKLLITLGIVLLILLTFVSLTIAYTMNIKGSGPLGVWFLLTFGVVIVLAQLIPACFLFSGLVNSAYSMFRKRNKGEEPTPLATAEKGIRKQEF